MRRFAAVLLPALAGACEAEPGLLDRDRIHDIARSEGTARGERFSGRYHAEWLAQTCSCADQGTTAEVTGCSQGSLYAVPLQLVQSDGHLRASAAGYDINGGIDEDGSFETGALADGTTFGTRGELIVYFTGTLTQSSDGGLRLDAEFIRHLEGELLISTDAGPIDCTDTFVLEGARL